MWHEIITSCSLCSINWSDLKQCLLNNNFPLQVDFLWLLKTENNLSQSVSNHVRTIYLKRDWATLTFFFSKYIYVWQWEKWYVLLWPMFDKKSTWSGKLLWYRPVGPTPMGILVNSKYDWLIRINSIKI